jgi:hypothetical protein
LLIGGAVLALLAAAIVASLRQAAGPPGASGGALRPAQAAYDAPLRPRLRSFPTSGESEAQSRHRCGLARLRASSTWSTACR